MPFFKIRPTIAVYEAYKRNESDFKAREAKRVMGLQVPQGGVKPTTFPILAECISLYEIEVDINSMLQLQERHKTP